MGNSIKILLKGLKESTLKVIEEKFEKVAVININNNSTNNKINNNILEQVFPRIDISKKITPSIIKDLTEGKWANKKEAITSIENIIKSTNNTIQPKGLNELFNCIKLNLKDSNKNVVKMIMKLIEELCEALGNTGFRQYQKQIIPGIISNFADKNTQVKEEAIKCIDQLIKIMGFDSIGSHFPTYLNGENFETKYEILTILIKNKKFISNRKEYIKEYVTPLINCLLDKNGNIRNMAEEIVEEIIKYYEISIFNDEIKYLKKPTIINQVKLILNKINKKINENNEKLNYINVVNNNNENASNNNNKGPKDVGYSNEENINPNNIFNNNSYNNNQYNKNLYNNYPNNNNIYNNYPYNNNTFINQNIINNNNVPMNQPFLLNSMLQNNLNPQPSSNEITYLLKQLYSSDINGKYVILNNILLFLQKNENNLNEKTIEEIFDAFNTLLSSITNNIKSIKDGNLEIQNIIENNQDIKLLKYLIDVYYDLSNQNQLMSLLDNELIIYECYERLFIIITEKSLISFQCGTNLIKSLNSIIMNFLNNCNVTISIISLIKIILNYKSNTDDTAEVCTLAIKGLDKYRPFIFKLINILNMNKIFESFYQFFSEFEKTNENLIPHNINEKNALDMINSLICEFIKIYGDKIWDVYNNSLSNDLKRIDIYFRRSIQNILRNYKNNNVLMNSNLNINFNIANNNNNFINVNNLSSVNNAVQLFVNPDKGKDKNNPFLNNNINDFRNEEENVMFLVNKIKENGKIMDENERNNIYQTIVSLLKKNSQSITSISTKLDNENFTKIYELYHSFDQNNNIKINNKENNKINNNNNGGRKILLSDERGNKLNQNNKNKDYNLTDQAKRIQEYKNLYFNITEARNIDKNKNDIFSDNNNNFNFKGKINDENKQMNNNFKNDISTLELEARKKEIDEISKMNNNYSKLKFNSQSDIPQNNTSFITTNIIYQNTNINTGLNNDNRYLTQRSICENESIINMRKNLDNIKLKVIRNVNQQKKY